MKDISDLSNGRCQAALNIAGEGYQCELGKEHGGMAHQNREAEAIWSN